MLTLPGVLRANRDFRLAFLADLTSSLGSNASTIAFPLLVLSLHGNALQAGLVATVSVATRLALRLPAGYLVDRCSWRTVMLGTDAVRCAALGSIPAAALLGGPAYPHLLAVAVVEGSATALFGPAVTTLTRDVATGPQLPEALGLGQAVQAVTTLVGPALGGALFAVDRILPFTADAVSYAGSVLLVWRIAVRPAPAAGRAATAAAGGVTAGLRWLFRERVLFTVMLYASVINMVAAAIDVMVVVVLRSHGESGPLIGLIVSCAGVGAVIGSLLAPRIVRTLAVPTILLGIGTGWAAVLAVFALVYSPFLTAALLTVLMTLSPAAGVAVGNALYSRTPRPLIGRVSAGTSVLLTGLSALGPIAAGALVEAFGAAGGWLVMAGVTAAVTAAGWLPLQASRYLAPAEPAGPPQAATAPPSAPARPDVVAHREQPDEPDQGDAR